VGVAARHLARCSMTPRGRIELAADVARLVLSMAATGFTWKLLAGRIQLLLLEIHFTIGGYIHTTAKGALVIYQQSCSTLTGVRIERANCQLEHTHTPHFNLNPHTFACNRLSRRKCQKQLQSQAAINTMCACVSVHARWWVKFRHAYVALINYCAIIDLVKVNIWHVCLTDWKIK